MRTEWRTDLFTGLPHCVRNDKGVPSSPPLEGWRECDGVVERVRNYNWMLSNKRPPPPFGYSSTGGELATFLLRAKFPSRGRGIKNATVVALVLFAEFAQSLNRQQQE